MDRRQEVQPWIEQAAAFFEKREVEKAEQLYERSLRHCPDHQEALMGLGLIYVATGRGPLFLRRMQQLQRDYPASPGPYRVIVTILRISGHVEMAKRYLTNHLESAPSDVEPVIRLSLAEVYAALGDQEGVRKELQELATLPVLEPLSYALLLMEATDSAGLQQLSQKVEGHSLRLALQGMSAEAAGDLGTAAQLYYEASNAPAATWICLNALAAMWLNSGNLSACRGYLDQAEQAAPNNSEIQITRARYLAARGDRDDARALLKQITDVEGNFTRLKNLASGLLRSL